MIRIGYQGIEGANAEQAAHDLVEKVGITEEVKYVPLVDSEHVINALVSKDINYGVCAIYNSVAGIVLATVAATNGVELYIKADTTLNIHHCMFKKSPDIPDNNMTAVASHVLAIKQCEEHLHELYPQISVEAQMAYDKLWNADADVAAIMHEVGDIYRSYVG